MSLSDIKTLIKHYVLLFFLHELLMIFEVKCHIRFVLFLLTDFTLILKFTNTVMQSLQTEGI